MSTNNYKIMGQGVCRHINTFTQTTHTSIKLSFEKVTTTFLQFCQGTKQLLFFSFFFCYFKWGKKIKND